MVGLGIAGLLHAMGLKDLFKLKDICVDISEGLRKMPQDHVLDITAPAPSRNFYGRNHLFLRAGR
jgi:hypothetical protein